MAEPVLDAIAPEMAGLSDEVKAVWLSLATPFVPPAIWLDCTALALAYMAAHLYTLSQRGVGSGATGGASGTGAVGAVSAVAAGKWSIGFGGPSTTINDRDAWLAQTHHGLAFVGLRGTLAAGRPFALNLGRTP